MSGGKIDEKYLLYLYVVKRKNREVLISVMNNNGFSVYPYEWWNFDYKEWEKFELLDLSFEQLEKTK